MTKQGEDEKSAAPVIRRRWSSGQKFATAILTTLGGFGGMFTSLIKETKRSAADYRALEAQADPRSSTEIAIARVEEAHPAKDLSYGEAYKRIQAGEKAAQEEIDARTLANRKKSAMSPGKVALDIGIGAGALGLLGAAGVAGLRITRRLRGHPFKGSKTEIEFPKPDYITRMTIDESGSGIEIFIKEDSHLIPITELLQIKLKERDAHIYPEPRYHMLKLHLKGWNGEQQCWRKYYAKPQEVIDVLRAGKMLKHEAADEIKEVLDQILAESEIKVSAAHGHSPAR